MEPGQQAIGATTASQTQMIPSLAVLNSKGATLKDGVLTMSGISANSIVFADRPWQAGGACADVRVQQAVGRRQGQLRRRPANAPISVLSSTGDTVEDAVGELKMPKLTGDTLTFEVGVLKGEIKKADGPASLFIDRFAARGGYGHVGVVGGFGYHAQVWHGGW